MRRCGVWLGVVVQSVVGGLRRGCGGAPVGVFRVVVILVIRG
ncbi:hypothetical protein I551_6624 [Mycobacterium ulcerans str. Harvey]|uniref:Uncharacterized protein n=1 Tax=Mycobacterium ulcerans str. Harvey TaxID=1299332 RepID=A0ABN0QQ96_MYCUL|nr:hypothetical protein I551_6624 [Mycobacterium ulcerans str. Harvey]